jgi:hypothetical protein
MPDGWITDPEVLLKEVGVFTRLKERRRFERRKLLVAANIEVKGERFEGVIVDVSPGGARIRFDTPLTAGDELNLVLTELGQLGAQVVWQRHGEAGVRFLLAPDEMAPRVQELLAQEQQARAVSKRKEAKPSVLRRREAKTAAEGARLDPALLRAVKLAGAGLACIIGVVIGAMMIASSLAREAPRAPLVLNGGEQHGCASLLGRVTGSTNQIDFSLNVASAAQFKCLDLQHPGRIDHDLHGHMIQAVKVPVQ